MPDFVPIQRVLGICPTAGLSGPRCPPTLIEWLIDPCDKPWSGKVHATIVHLD